MTLSLLLRLDWRPNSAVVVSLNRMGLSFGWQVMSSGKGKSKQIRNHLDLFLERLKTGFFKNFLILSKFVKPLRLNT